MEEKLIMVLSLEKFNEYNLAQFNEEVNVRAAIRLGYLAIQNPDSSFQWIGHVIKVDTDEKLVKVYIKVNTFAADPTEYLLGE